MCINSSNAPPPSFRPPYPNFTAALFGLCPYFPLHQNKCWHSLCIHGHMNNTSAAYSINNIILFAFTWQNGLIYYQMPTKRNQQYSPHVFFVWLRWPHHFSTLFVFRIVIEMAHLPCRNRCTQTLADKSQSGKIAEKKNQSFLFPGHLFLLFLFWDCFAFATANKFALVSVGSRPYIFASQQSARGWTHEFAVSFAQIIILYLRAVMFIELHFPYILSPA